MTKLEVFDPAMCCSTGVCGPAVDPKLVRFAADLEWLATTGVEVRRYNLAQEPAAFAGNPIVQQALVAEGPGCLPLLVVDGRIVARATYPSREILGELAGVRPPVSLFTEAVQELVAIGASIASNCEPCFRFHYDKARKLGVSKEDMARAVATAQMVKESPARSVLQLAEKYLAGKEETPKAEPCCAPSPKGGKKCC